MSNTAKLQPGKLVGEITKHFSNSRSLCARLFAENVDHSLLGAGCLELLSKRMPGDLLGIYLAHQQLLKTMNGDTPPPPENRTQRHQFYARILADKEARTLRIASELDRAYHVNAESRKKAAATAAAQTKSSHDKVSRHEEAAEKRTTDTSMPKAGQCGHNRPMLLLLGDGPHHRPLQVQLQDVLCV